MHWTESGKGRNIAEKKCDQTKKRLNFDTSQFIIINRKLVSLKHPKKEPHSFFSKLKNNQKINSSQVKMSSEMTLASCFQFRQRFSGLKSRWRGSVDTQTDLSEICFATDEIQRQKVAQSSLILLTSSSHLDLFSSFCRS